MNKPFLLSAAAVLAAGAIVFARQTGRLQEVRSAQTTPGGLVKAPASRVPETRTWAPPPAKGSEPAGQLLDRLGAKLVESLSPAQLASFLEAADAVELGRIGFAAELTEQERKLFAEKYTALRRERAELIKRTDLHGPAREAAWTALADQKNKWTEDQLGQDRLAKVEAARQSALRAGAEHEAARLVSRISNASDLTTGQKDRLYAALLDRSQTLPPAAPSRDDALVFRTRASITEEPSVPRLFTEARTILTPEQWAVYDQSRTLRARQQQTTMEAFQGMIPTAIVTLQEFLNESPPVPAASPGQSGK